MSRALEPSRCGALDPPGAPHRPVVGFVGLGDQGYPMAQRIIEAGFPLAVHARRSGVVDPLVGLGARARGSVADLAAECDVLALCVGDDGDVLDVARVALPVMRRGATLVIHSTVSPATCEVVGREASRVGVEVLDAPVSGGRARAFEGALTVMVGGDAEAFAAVRPVLDTFGALVLHVGPLGAGQVLKLVNNTVFTAQIAITRDTLAVVGALGLDVPAAMEAISVSTGSSRSTEMCVAGGAVHAFPRHSDGRRRGAELLAKDIGLAYGVYAARAVELPPDLDRLVGSGLQFALDSGAAEAVVVAEPVEP